MKTVMLYGCEADFEVCVSYMDDEIREELHAKIAPCTEQEFIDAYVICHEENFGEKFDFFI